MSFSRPIVTRGKVECPICGAPSQFSGIVLPTCNEVMNCYLWERYTLREDSAKEPTFYTS